MTTSLKSLAMLLAYLLICQPLLPSVASAQPPAGVEELRPSHPWESMPQPAPPGPQPPGPAAPVPLSSTMWTPIGPAPLGTTSPANSNFNVSGRLGGIAAHPTDPNTIYVAAAGGGVWKTTDGGTTWTPLTDSQSTVSMGAIAIAPSNSNMIYAGTGEGNNSLDSNYGRGILTSTDGGATWTLRTAAGAFDRKSTSKIAVDPTNANITYAAITDPGANGLGGNNGVWKTTDGGATWTNTTTAISATVQWTDVVVDPTTPTTLYAAVGSLFGDALNGVYKSTNSGTSWSLQAGAPSGTAAGRIAIAIAPSNSQVVYASASASGAPFGALYKIMRSDNGGTSWTDLTAGTPNYMGGQGWYDTTLAVDPANAAIVYAAGSAGANSILRSTNSGASWTDIRTGGAPTNSSPHADHHAAVFDANGRLLDGDDGGIWRLDSPTTPSWTNLNGNLATIQLQGVGLHPTNPNIAVGGSQDNGAEVFGGNALWTETDGGDGGSAKFSPTNGMRAYHQIPNLSFGTNFFRRSDDAGQTWTTKTSSISADVNVQNFYAPLAVDPGNGDRVLYGTNRVWETTTGGDSWTNISTVAANGFNSGGSFVDAIALAPSDVNTVYAATGGAFAGSSQIFVTTNHGGLWTEQDLPAGTGRVSDLQVDSANAQIAYATINRFGGTNGQVYKTVNGGSTWTNITGNLPAIPAWSLQIDSVQNRLFVGADDGVYVTTNGGTSWSRFGTGLPNAQVFQIELNSALNILTAATHGRSAWQISTAASAAAVMTTPTPGTTLPGSSVTFGWTSGTGISEYWLYVGSTPGGADLYNSSTGTAQSATVGNLPEDGRTLYVRLWSLIAGTTTWQFNDYTYTAASAQIAMMTTPAPGSVLASSSVTFGWTTGNGISQYWLYVGSTPGGADLYNSTTGTSQSVTVNNLPRDGRTLYVRLWSLRGSTWHSNDYLYMAGPKAMLTTPPPQSALSSTTVFFGWSTGSGISQYWLYVGTTAGGTDLYNQSTGTTRSASVSGLPSDGRTVYVRLWSLQSNNSWQFNDSTYTAMGAGPRPMLTMPTPGVTLPGSTVTFGWSAGTGISQYWLYVGSASGGSDLYNSSTGTNLSAMVSGLPKDGRVLYVRLWSLLSGTTTWQFNDYTYGAATGGTPGM